MSEIVVSLTTIHSRLTKVQPAIVSILNQTLKPNIIHVFYSSEPRLYDEGIPAQEISALEDALALINVTSYTKIQFTKTSNIGPYRKLVPALKLYPTDIIITIDDDHEHEPAFIQRYVDLYNDYKCIICSGGRKIDLKNINANKIVPDYMNITNMPMLHLVPEGFGGILYHAAMFGSDFVDFDFAMLDDHILKNDDVFFRLYTFKRGIKVMVTNVCRNHLLELGKDISLFETYNVHQNYIDTIKYINEHPFMSKLETHCPTTDFIDMMDEIYTARELTNIKQGFRFGTDIKLLQYENNVSVRCNDAIDFTSLLNNNNNNGRDPHLVLINILKDTKRYDSAVEEFKKLSIPIFVHLKATYWRDRENYISDLNTVLDFLKGFNTFIPTTRVTMTPFSELNDSNIHIQDGPLACYISHLRAMIYGYHHFSDYTIICEDDILVSNTLKIKQYIKEIPPNWDVIMFNSVPIEIDYENAPWYQLKNRFYSAHFYIIRNSAFPLIFAHMYPITDQVDILLSKLHDRLKIYNIIDTVYQKNFSTNTQNNLYVIYHSVGYEPIRAHLKEIHELYATYIERLLHPILQSEANQLTENIISDVLHNYIMTNSSSMLIGGGGGVGEAIINANHENFPYPEYQRIYELMHIVINCCVKGIGIHKIVTTLMSDIQYILNCFCMSFAYCPSREYRPYGYGSSANIFYNALNGEILKVYNDRLRWLAPTHTDPIEVFDRESAILQCLDDGRLIFVDRDSRIICMKWLGESLYDKFILPSNWRDQLAAIFARFTQKGICYPEFNLKNIVVQGDILSLIDFGLASIDVTANNINTQALANFIELLDILQLKLTNAPSSEGKLLYKTFINNLRLNPVEKYTPNIY